MEELAGENAIPLGIVLLRVDTGTDCEPIIGEERVFLNVKRIEKLATSSLDGSQWTHILALCQHKAVFVQIERDVWNLWCAEMYQGYMRLRIYARRSIPSTPRKSGARASANRPPWAANWDAILPQICSDSTEWYALSRENDRLSSNATMLWNPDLVSRKVLIKANWPLTELYQNLPSPPPCPSCADDLPLRCSLFSYQRNSLAKLLQREKSPITYCDPYFLERVSPIEFRGESNYVMDPTTYEFFPRSSINTYPDLLGGILCDEMGVGKTIICLALILETLSQVSRPAQEPMASATTSELALTFPDPEYSGKDPAEALVMDQVVTAAFGAPSPGERISRTRKPNSEPEVTHESHSKLGLRVSLTQITAHRIRTTMRVPPSENLPPQLRTLLGPVSAPFIHLWPPPPARLSRISQGRTPIRVYLTSATLILVPRTLLVQWVEEIDKHVLPGALRIFRVSDMHTPLPDALTLSQSYDIVLMSHARFGKEAGDDRQGLRSDLDTSPIMQVYWKRVMIDEGNILAGDSLIVRLCSLLRVERRWIVTGTPTEALVGSSLRAAGRTVSAAHVFSSGWTSAERKSLDRLKLLLVRFLRLAPFAGATAALASAARASGLPSGKERDWNQLMGASKESHTNQIAKHRLYDILSRVMVRNRVEDVEKECPLPPLHHRTIRLTPSELERKTYNVLQALIVLNAALSQESDKDYFFHPSNRKALASVMENLSLACFHFAGRGFEEQTRNARELIETQHNTLPSRYQESIQEAIFHLDEALNDPSWHAHIASSDVMYHVHDADSDIVRAWAGSHAILLTANDLVQLRRATALLQSNTQMDAEELREEVITKGSLYVRRKHGKATENRSASAKPSIRLASEANTASSSQSRVRNAADNRGRSRAFWEDLLELPEEMDNAMIIKSSSTKLDAIMQEIFHTAANEKILLFSMQENVLFEIAAALDVAQVPYLCYVAGMPQRIRNEYASIFTHQSTYRCLLMSTSVGGRGLDLHCASRVIFTEPVWQMDLESQAVKRAWRMGQTRQVVVSTYVMRETFEEQILERKNHRIQATSLEQEDNVRTLSDDPGMRLFVAHPKFVPSLTSKDESWDLWLFQTQRPWLFSSHKRVKLG